MLWYLLVTLDAILLRSLDIRLPMYVDQNAVRSSNETKIRCCQRVYQMVAFHGVTSFFPSIKSEHEYLDNDLKRKEKIR